MQMKRSLYALIGAALTTFLGGAPSWAQSAKVPDAAQYDPVINPKDFGGPVNNRYFTLKPGTKFTFKDNSGNELVEEAVTNETKTVMGVPVVVVRVRDWRNGVLREDTRDWYAQDKAGNVWYFGETVDNYRDGKVVNHQGSWEAGVDGAKPGIIMPAEPKIGETYRQEYYKGVAEDVATVVALDKKVTVGKRIYEGCLQTSDFSRVSPSKEYKFYCPEVGFMVLEEPIGAGNKVELVEISSE
jgi:hypothetical protein